MTNRELAIKIIKRLHKAGRQALLAGGCVRDMLLNRTAKDYDVATDAHPDDVVKLFKRTLRIGAKFGVVMVMEQDQKVEVATFRTEQRSKTVFDPPLPGSLAWLRHHWGRDEMYRARLVCKRQCQHALSIGF